MISLFIGSLGVGLLLLAFVFNLLKIVNEKSITYLFLNFVGAGLASWYAFDSNIIPFVILELVWAGTAFIRLIFNIKKGSQAVT